MLVSHSSLFTTEGNGLIVRDFSQENSTFYIDAIRRITEQFNLIGYQHRSNNIDFNIIYFELGQLIDTIYIWINAINDSEYKNFVMNQSFPYFIEMYQNTVKERKKLARKTYISMC